MAVVAVVSCAAVGCADSHFQPDAEDARRLDLLHGDPLAVSLAAPGACTDSTAHYRPSSGEPLDFAAVEDSAIRCTRALGSVEDLLGVVSTAEGSGWTPSVEGGRGGRFRFRKRLGGVWASATVDVGPTSFSVELSMPPHTGTGEPLAAVEAAQGRACLDALKARRTPPPDCPPQVP